MHCYLDGEVNFSYLIARLAKGGARGRAMGGGGFLTFLGSSLRLLRAAKPVQALRGA